MLAYFNQRVEKTEENERVIEPLRLFRDALVKEAKRLAPRRKSRAKVKERTAMMKLCDLIALSNVNLGHFKIHCATGEGTNSPLLAFFDGKFKEWQEHQSRRNFKCEKIVSLIHRYANKWVFAGVWSVLGVTAITNGTGTWFQYSTSEEPGLDHLTGKAIVTFSRSFRASYLKGKRYADQLMVSQLLEERLSIGDFPGFSSVLINYDELRHIVCHNLTSWRAALKCVAGVYLIADTSCGKHYIGSAYGTDGIWGRWSIYATCCNGGNAELRELLKKHGDSHARFFRFSILEICDLNSTKDEVLARECHWKNALLTREFGYNAN